MQTFLPYPNFVKSAQCLDYRRLGKQRVEAFQIYNIVSGKRTTGGWVNHPAVKMWRGYSELLAHYHNVIIQEWVDRGYNNNMQFIPERDWSIKKYPSWLGNDKLHSSHRSNLLRKDYDHYSQFGWSEPNDLNYYWING